MTSLPIMWFALFDFQYQKDAVNNDSYALLNKMESTIYYFMKNPHLYKIGINCECFSVKLFVNWVAYGLWHALVILMLVYYPLEQYGTSQKDGKEVGFWIGGMAVYGACVFIANAVLFLKFTIHNQIGIILFSLMISAYFVFYFLFNYLKGHIHHIFATSFSQLILWLTFLLTLG